jgi:hypothetical protein
MCHMKKIPGFLKALLFKIACTCFFSVCAFSKGYSQELPKVIKPSPETAALFRFADYPMDYSTGLPQISIPIYQVQSGSLSVPISISYHASGRRVSDQDGPVALGWSLNAGGMISRTVYGAPDFGSGNHGTYNFPYPFKTSDFDIVNDLVYLEKAIHYANQDASITPWTDSEYDVFSYSFNNNSGKFIFKDNNGVKTAALLPYKAYVVKPIYDQWGLGAIEITDDKGVLYKFTGAERYSASADQVVSGLVLTQIISADKTDVITFKYSTFVQSRVSVSQQSVLTDDMSTGNPEPGTSTTDSEQHNSENYQISRLTEIDFNQGKVLFNLVSGDDKVDNIQVINLNNEVIKTIQFNRSAGDLMSDGARSTNKLDGLVFKDKTGAGIENYGFQYYPTQLPNGGTYVNLRHCDWWGYYNASGVQSMVPRYTNIPYLSFAGGAFDPISVGDPSTNRTPNLAALKSGVLRKITFPTGGSTEFTFENNSYISNMDRQSKPGPGLRVSQVTTDDNRGTISTKVYKYGVNESGYGFIDMEPGLNMMASEAFYHFELGNGFNPNMQGGYRQRTFYSGFIPELSAVADRPVIYTEVTEYHGTATNNTGKTVYNYDNYAWGTGPMPAFFNMGTFPKVPPSIYKMHIPSWNYWNNPSLTYQTDYKRIISPGGITYQKRKQITNIYDIDNIEDVAGLHVGRIYNLPQGGRQGTLYIEAYVMHPPMGGTIPIYTYSEYHIPVGIKNLTSTGETIYNDDGSTVSNSTSYVYNASQFISQTNRTGSDNISLSTQIKYPADYTGNAVLTQMVDPTLHMLNYPVEQNEFKNGLPVKGVRTNYFDWGSTTPMIAPQSIDVKTSTNAYEPRLRYYGYDNGNPLSVSKENGALISYIWDYQNTYPIAEAKNAAKTDIAYTSFEADGTGNWAGINTANIVTTANSITGSKYYNFSGTSLSKASLTSSTAYTVSYWSKNGMYTVSGTPIAGWPKSIRTVSINGATWTNWEHRVSGVSTISVSGTGVIDELRLYPANALMTSYTFAPLIGMTSQNSAANGINYFEYDANGRLKLVRDINNNIVKTFNYKYQSATP